MPRYLLTVKKADAIKKPGRYSDGGGLYLVVGEGEARSWIMRIMQRGKRHDIGLGSGRLCVNKSCMTGLLRRFSIKRQICSRGFRIRRRISAARMCIRTASAMYTAPNNLTHA